MTDIRAEELLDVLDERGRVVGRATRRACHSNPALMHQAVHVLVFDGQGRLWLQQRSCQKDIQPGRWDSSVGGHLRPGEAPEDGARREMREELGVEPSALQFLYEYRWRSDVETEWVRTYRTRHAGPFQWPPEEIEAGRFWPVAEIEAGLGQGTFTPNFEFEFRTWKEHEAS